MEVSHQSVLKQKILTPNESAVIYNYYVLRAFSRITRLDPLSCRKSRSRSYQRLSDLINDIKEIFMFSV